MDRMKYLILCIGLIASLASAQNTEQVITQNCVTCHDSKAEISFMLTKSSNVKLIVYNLLGQKIKTIANHTLPAGHHSLTWNGKNEKGESAASGVYLFKIETEKFAVTRKMTLVK